MESLNNRCHFDTQRLKAYSLKDEIDNSLAQKIIQILSPEVTKSLPQGWQNINSVFLSINWVKERLAESVVLVVESIEQNDIIGFIFLYELDDRIIRFGYLLSKETWGKGIGTELMKGFVDWCKQDGHIKSISGGVEKINIGSIKVLKKVGFKQIESNVSLEDNLFYEYKFI